MAFRSIGEFGLRPSTGSRPAGAEAPSGRLVALGAGSCAARAPACIPAAEAASFRDTGLPGTATNFSNSSRVMMPSLLTSILSKISSRASLCSSTNPPVPAMTAPGFVALRGRCTVAWPSRFTGTALLEGESPRLAVEDLADMPPLRTAAAPRARRGETTAETSTRGAAKVVEVDDPVEVARINGGPTWGCGASSSVAAAMAARACWATVGAAHAGAALRRTGSALCLT
mmetsp:Transcript_2453/g.7331  ORF Transcript_2453/g.7331 Transcript_2453/m.7331 type:complete len:229 (+) Transcript_2453:160-846(+)